MVKDRWESSNKQQQTGILDRLAYLKSVLSYMLILFHLFKNSTNVKKFPSGLLLPFLTAHLERNIGLLRTADYCIKKHYFPQHSVE